MCTSQCSAEHNKPIHRHKQTKQWRRQKTLFVGCMHFNIVGCVLCKKFFLKKKKQNQLAIVLRAIDPYSASPEKFLATPLIIIIRNILVRQQTCLCPWNI